MRPAVPRTTLIGAAVSLAVAGCSGTPSHATAGHGPTPRETSSASPTGSPATSPARPAAGARVTVSAVGRMSRGLSRTVAVLAGQRVLLLSGLRPGDVSTAEVAELDPSTGATRVLGALPRAVHDASGAYLHGQAVVFGGGAGPSIATVQAFGPGGARAVGSLRAGRSDSASAILGSTAYVVGGFNGQVMDRGIEATGDGSSLRTVGRLALGVRYPAATAAGGAVWVIGGQLATTESTRSGGQTDDIQRFDPTSGRTTVVGHLPVPLGHAAAVTLGGTIYVVGGRTGAAPSAQIWRIDPATYAVTKAGRLPFAYSDMAAVATTTGQALLIGGETTGPLAPLRTVLRLTLRQ